MVRPVLHDLSKDSSVSDDRLKSFESNLNELKKTTLHDEKQLSTRQTEKLKRSTQSIQDIKIKVQTQRIEAENNLARLNRQAEKYKVQLDGGDVYINNPNYEQERKQKIAQYQAQHLKNCQQRIQLAKKVDTLKLKKLDLDERKSSANQVFKWCMVALYSQPESKYYWPNFLEQAIELDKGEDFKERLGKYEALYAKEEARVKTVKFLAHEKNVLEASQFKGFEGEIQNIIAIAKVFADSAELGRKIREIQKELEAYRKSFQQQDQGKQQITKNYTAMKERITITEAYLNQLRTIEKTLNEKSQKYQAQLNHAQTFVKDLASISSLPALNIEQRRDTCSCNIY